MGARIRILLFVFQIAIVPNCKAGLDYGVIEPFLKKLTSDYPFITIQGDSILLKENSTKITLHINREEFRLVSIAVSGFGKTQRITQDTASCRTPGKGLYAVDLIEIINYEAAIYTFNAQIFAIEIISFNHKKVYQLPLIVLDSIGNYSRPPFFMVTRLDPKDKLNGEQYIWDNGNTFVYIPDYKALRRYDIPTDFRKYFYYNKNLAFQFFYYLPITPSYFFKIGQLCGIPPMSISSPEEVGIDGKSTVAFYKRRNYTRLRFFFHSGKTFI